MAMTGREFIKILCKVTIGQEKMAELARQTGISRDVFSCIKNGQQKAQLKPEYADLVIKRYPNVNKTWLLAPDDNTPVEIFGQEIIKGVSPFERIEAISKHYGLSIPQLEIAIGASKNHLYQYRNRIKNISDATFRAFIRTFPRLNPAYLTQGIGPIVFESDTKAVEPHRQNYENNSLISECERLENAIREATIVITESTALLSELRSILDDVRYNNGIVAEKPHRNL